MLIKPYHRIIHARIKNEEAKTKKHALQNRNPSIVHVHQQQHQTARRGSKGKVNPQRQNSTIDLSSQLRP
jgi:hypothetical protein